MARSVRQSKIIEIISNQEIDTQEELVVALANAGFDVTQATISRDIKELRLFKINGINKKYRYAFVDNEDKAGSTKTASIYKEAVFWVKSINNLVLIKTLKGVAGAISNFIDRLNIDNVLGCVFGDDTVMVVSYSDEDAKIIEERLKNIITN